VTAFPIGNQILSKGLFFSKSCFPKCFSEIKDQSNLPCRLLIFRRDFQDNKRKTGMLPDSEEFRVEHDNGMAGSLVEFWRRQHPIPDAGM
ncbi:hypothetical protein DNTS_017019, partial [Danionella cerebrum]